MDLSNPQRFFRQLIKFLLSLALFCSCSKGTFRTSSELKHISISIPSSLNENNETILFIATSVNDLNQWIDVFEILHKDYSDLELDELDEMSVYNRVQLMQLTSEYLNKKRLYNNTCASIHEKAFAISRNLQSQEKNSFDSLFNVLDTKMQLIDTQVELAYHN